MKTSQNPYALFQLRRLLAVAVAFVFVLFAGAAQAQVSPAAGYWWNPTQGGTGFVIEVQGTQMFMAGFLYAATGEATWVASSGPMTNSNSYSGSLITYNGGQTLTGAYKGATLSSPPLGTISMNFTSSTQGTLTWPGGNEAIQRFDFGPGGSTATQPATNPQTGWWWNPNEGGRGFAIEVQGGSMYFATYMYDSAGNAIWYLATGNMTNQGLFQGDLTQYEDGLSLTGGYKVPSVANTNVGAVTLQFSGTSDATLTLPGGRQIPLARFNFGVAGPTLSAFSAAAEAPAQLLTITGTNINPSATLSLTLADSTGYSVSVPLTAASATSVTVSVPPYFNTTNGAFGSGTVSATLNQSSGGTSASSNTLPGLTIQKLATSGNGAGNSTLSLLHANLKEAQLLQTSIKGTAQDTPAVEAQIATQISDLQALLTNVQNVVQNGTSFSLGAVGGTNITVNSSNIADVDNLILATLQSLTAAPGGGDEKSAEQANFVGCMSAEAQAFEAAVANGTTGTALDDLALALLEAPYSSTACGTVNAFTSAYQIFGGAGDIGLGFAIDAGLLADAAIFPGAALFTTVNANANIAVGLNALLAPALAAEAAEVQAALSGVAALSQPATAELIAEATGLIAAYLVDSQAFINLVAPLYFTSNTLNLPTNLPAGTYSISYTFTVSVPGDTQSGSGGPIPITNSDASLFASELETNFNSFESAICAENGVTCNGTFQVTPFNGTSLKFVWSFSSGPASFTITYVITKTG